MGEEDARPMGCGLARLAWLVAASALAGCSASPDGAEATTSTSAALQQCLDASVEGIDVSDGQGAIDWNAVKAAGVDFALVKATQGTYDTQSTFAANWAGARAAGVIRGAYHFFDPTEDGAAQAQHFLAVVGAVGAGDLPAMLDIECPTGRADTTCLGTGTSDAASAADIAARMWDFIDAVEQATGKKPLVYTYGSYFASNGVDTTGLDAYPLCIADPVAGSCFDVPPPWSSALLWQYSFTGDVPGISDAVDRDRFLGTLSDLQELAASEVSADASAGAPAAVEAGAGRARTDGGVDASDAAGASNGCECRMMGSRATAACSGSSGAVLAGLTLALVAWRRRHSGCRVLAGRSKESPCRRPTSARG